MNSNKKCWYCGVSNYVKHVFGIVHIMRIWCSLYHIRSIYDLII